jgi:hypothetical protein
MDNSVNSSGNKLLDLCLSTDSKIVNGRLGNDAGIGNFTFMSNTGKSLIEYVLMQCELFPFVLFHIINLFNLILVLHVYQKSLIMKVLV